MPEAPFTIETGVPIPDSAGSTEGPMAQAIRRMEVGQCLTVQMADVPPLRSYPSAWLGKRARRILGAGNYKVRAYGDVVRLWRLA